MLVGLLVSLWYKNTDPLLPGPTFERLRWFQTLFNISTAPLEIYRCSNAVNGLNMLSALRDNWRLFLVLQKRSRFGSYHSLISLSVWRSMHLQPHPHSIPAGGRSGPQRCLPTAIKIKKKMYKRDYRQISCKTSLQYKYLILVSSFSSFGQIIDFFVCNQLDCNVKQKFLLESAHLACTWMCQ